MALFQDPPRTEEELARSKPLEIPPSEVLTFDEKEWYERAFRGENVPQLTVRAVLIHSGFAPATAEVTQRAATPLELSGASAEQMAHLLVALEELDEVRDVYSNVEISDEVLSRI